MVSSHTFQLLLLCCIVFHVPRSSLSRSLFHISAFSFHLPRSVSRVPSPRRAAAGVGNREMLCFLFEEGCPWDRRTCAAASRNSDLETLKWLRLKGCPWDSRVLDAAAEVGAMDVFEWATSNNCPS